MDGSVLLAWLAMGVGVAALVKLALPWKTPDGYLVTILFGVTGSLLGGFLFSQAGIGALVEFNVIGLVASFLGTLITYGLYPLAHGRFLPKRASPPRNHQLRDDERLHQQAQATLPKNQTLRCKVFVSYRRVDSSDVTGRIYDRLVGKFGKENIFKDVDSMPLGVDFRRHLEESLSTCSVLIVVIGRQWLSSVGGASLSDPDNFVRIEIETTLRRRIPIIPVLVQGASLPSETDLPPSIKNLVYHQGIDVRPDPDFHRDVDRLIAGVRSCLAE